MKQHARQAADSLKFLALCLVVCGGLYSFAVLGISRLCFPVQADGSMTETAAGQVSTLAGTADRSAGHLWGRLQKLQTAQKEDGTWYVVGVPASHDVQDPAYLAAREAEIRKVQAASPEAEEDVPEDLVTWSASGCDPDLSLDAALWQVPRLARETGLDETRVEEIIRAAQNPGMLAAPTVNVLRVNMALDQAR